MKKIFYALIVVIIIGVGVFYGSQKLSEKNSVVENTNNGVIQSATFTCAEHKTIQALFFKDRVELTLSDKRQMLLSQAISASGARYANNDESFVFWNKGNTAFVDEGGKITFKDCVTNGEETKAQEAVPTSTVPKAQDTKPVGLANPASVNCSKVGGNLVIEKRGDGGEYGLCYFEDNRACEEWALFRGDCPYGGVKTTGFNTVDQKYCAWSGGQTSAVPNSVCTFKNGLKCSTEAYYNGTCSPTDTR